uniref:Glutathione synthetase n=1 Tax=Globodera rostochiensis TaxID=31243 RepID=A0A914GUB0_GLORO
MQTERAKCAKITVKNDQRKLKSSDVGKHLNVRDYVTGLIRNPEETEELIEYAESYAHSIGLVSRTNERSFSSEPAILVPIALLPSAFPRELYEQAVDVHATLAELYFRVACDHAFLVESFRDVCKTDAFTARMVGIVQAVHAEQNQGVRQPLTLSLQRADYLVHWEPQKDSFELKQIEFNIGPIGGPGCATQAAKLHAKMLDRLHAIHGSDMPMLAEAFKPDVKARQKFARTLYQAWKFFGDPNAILLYITNSTNDPMCHFEGLQFVQFEVEKHGKRDGHLVEVVQMTLSKAAERLTLDENGDFSLFVDGTKRVALAHITEGNMPEEFPTEREWHARTMLERSNAILSPNIRTELSSSKKIQQILAMPGILERFFTDEPDKCVALRRTFAGLWGLENDDEFTRGIINEAIRSPQNYVLKCQLEAGKGNFFDDELVKKLGQLTLAERGAFILQQKIKPMSVKNFLMRPFKPVELDDVIGELGIFGSLIGDQSTRKLLWNTVDGHVLKTRSASVNQAGVTAGFGVVDTPLLFDASEFF